MKKFAVWMKGFAAAILGGAAASAAQAATSGNVTPANLKTAAITGAVLTLSAYLTKSPVSGQ